RRQRVQYLLRNLESEGGNPAAGAAQLDDRVTFDAEASLEGQPFSNGNIKDLTIALGSSLLPEEFEQAALGLKSGETRRFEISLPADHPDAQLAGKAIQYILTLKKVEQPRYPDIDADFAVSLGIDGGDLERMRAEIKENLERETQRCIRLLLQRQVMDCLLECAALDAPRTLVEQDQRRLAEIARQNMEKQGARNHNAPISAEMFKERAERRIKLGLICAELIQQHDLQAQPEQVRAAVETLSKSYQAPQEIVRWYYADTQRLAEVEAEVAERNIIDFVLSKAKVEQQPMSFEALAKASQSLFTICDKRPEAKEGPPER
ncbi:trigger factor, partial [Candidatus Glomeribacter gigasporarum]|uniref:trigger factor n=1 Tax=Candidatus Glomeribacter gigasporarum TaxID=132144 RepID=UPI0006789582